jgi:hypothetical protein
MSTQFLERAAGVILILTAIIATSCTSSSNPKNNIIKPGGKPIGSSASACQGYLEREDIRSLVGDPTRFIQTERIYNDTFSTCGIYDPQQDRYILRFDVANRNVGGEFDQQMKEGQARPGAIVQNKIAAAFPEPDGTEAKALILLPGTYVVVFLRQGPMTAERLTRLLAIAGKIAATVPAPFGTAKPTPTPTR